MKLLFIGDIVGRSGRELVLSEVPRLKREQEIDCVIANAENSAHGFGATPSICKELFGAGVDIITTGDHVWDQKELTPYLAQEKRVLRPQNFPAGNPGSGLVLHSLQSGKKVLVLQLLGQVFHKEYVNCPFTAADEALKPYVLGGNVDAIFVDMHAETTSEKNAMGQYLDGRVSAVVGSHTHIPTADARILKKGTAYQTDAGMCGDYDSVIGMKTDTVMKRFLTKNQKFKMEVADGPATMHVVLIETDDKTGLAHSIKSIVKSS